MLAPSLHAFRAYASNHPELLRAEGPGPPSHDAGPPRIAPGHLTASAAALVLLLVALLVYWWLLPAPAAADSPYATADAGAAQSTAVDQWGQGTVPSLYQNDASWADVPYGQATLASTGAAPVALAMAYVAATGDTDVHPRRVRPMGHRSRPDRRRHRHRRLRSCNRPAPRSAWPSSRWIVDDADAAARHRLECARARRHPARHLRARQPRWWCSTTSTRTPASCCTTRRARAARPRGWAFDDITDAAALAFTVHEA